MMRVWRNGEPLTGSNGAQRFRVAHEGALAKVVLSISADPVLDVIAEHPTHANDIGVDLAPQSRSSSSGFSPSEALAFPTWLRCFWFGRR